jgi:hypothetical protein
MPWPGHMPPIDVGTSRLPERVTGDPILFGFCPLHEIDNLVVSRDPRRWQSWYATFVKVDRNMLFDLVAAANFMDIKPLLI